MSAAPGEPGPEPAPELVEDVSERVLQRRRQRQRQQLARADARTSLCRRISPSIVGIHSEQYIDNLCVGTGEGRVDWEAVPAAVDPVQGSGMGYNRGHRKRWQAESLKVILDAIIGDEELSVVDFGSGSGNPVLALAAMFPACQFVLLDYNETSIELAKERADAAGLANVRAVCDRIEDFREPFDVALAVHACGDASDHAQAQAVFHRAAYVIVPCCVGKLKANFRTRSPDADAESSAPDEVERSREDLGAKSGGASDPRYQLSQPRSSWMSSLCSPSEFMTLAAGADHESASRDCKQLVEHDRNAAAREADYVTALGRLYPASCTNKNDVLIGVPGSVDAEKCKMRKLRALASARNVESRGLGAGCPEVAAVSSNSEKTRATMKAARDNRCTFYDKGKQKCCQRPRAAGALLCQLHLLPGRVAPALEEKRELIEALSGATTSKERNRAAKLLKQFDPVPRHEMDAEACESSMRSKKHERLLGYVCWRCDKVKQSKHKVSWSTSMGELVICTGCYSELVGIGQDSELRDGEPDD